MAAARGGRKEREQGQGGRGGSAVAAARQAGNSSSMTVSLVAGQADGLIAPLITSVIVFCCPLDSGWCAPASLPQRHAHLDLAWFSGV